MDPADSEPPAGLLDPTDMSPSCSTLLLKLFVSSNEDVHDAKRSESQTPSN